MDQVDRADVQRRRHAHAAAAGDQPLDEVEADLAVIQAAVDMRSGDVQQRPGADGLREGDQNLHRERGGGPGVAVQHRGIALGEVGRHAPAIIASLAAAAGLD